MHSNINLDLGIKFRVLLFKVGLTRRKKKKKNTTSKHCALENKQQQINKEQIEFKKEYKV
jgi:hypothetical protein